MIAFDAEAYLRFLRAFPRRSAGAFLSLHRVKRLLALLGHPENSFTGVQVIGTTGKGSTVAMLEAALHAAGFRVGAFFSPHLTTWRERIRIDGQDITAPLFAATLGEIAPAVTAVEEELHDRPTVFEALVTAAAVAFQKADVPIAVVEAGIGARGDATSALSLPIKVITPVGFDHTRILGSTIEEIAQAKSGSIGPGTRFVIHGASNKAAKVIEARAEAAGVPWQRARGEVAAISLDGTTVSVSGRQHETNLIGVHQAGNLACALGALDALRSLGFPVSEEALCLGLKQVRHPGRFEILDHKPLTILDCAHNPDGLRALAGTLRALDRKNVHIIFRQGVDQPILAETLRAFGASSVLIPRFADEPSRLVSPERLQKGIHGSTMVPSLHEAIVRARQCAGTNGTVVLTGSFAFAAELEKIPSGVFATPRVHFPFPKRLAQPA